MISISKLWCETSTPSDRLRYGREASGPVVVFNATRRCNLACAHCYSASTNRADPDELDTDEAYALIDDLAALGVPVLLLSGGEPMMRGDLTQLIDRAARAGIRTALSTNGTLLTGWAVEALLEAGLRYAGISLDGLRDANDRIRGRRGAFDEAVAGIRNARRAGLKAGLRFTITRDNADQIAGVFRLVAEEKIQRVCFYHLVPTGRAAADAAPDAERTREIIDEIIDRTATLHDAGNPVEVLTVDNHADAPYVYLRLLRDKPAQAERCLELLRAQGGNASGQRIGCVSWNGDAHPDQFWRGHVLGNVRETPFSDIWNGSGGSGLLAALRDRRRRLKGRCATCRWLDICNGNLRARAEAATGDPWATDPACYLTDEETAA